MEPALMSKTKEGLSVRVWTSSPSDEPDWRDESGFRDQYREHGYAIARDLLPAKLMDEVVDHFRAEVKPYRGAILRQLSTRMEEHTFSDAGFMTNTILSVQDLVAERFANFRRSSLEALTHERVQAIVASLLGQPGKCVESMYFESSARGTITHADCHFMDASEPGEMVAAWFALEDIHPGAGRFYLLPKSHLIGTDDPDFAHLKAFRSDYEALSMKVTRSFRDNDQVTNAALRIQHGRMLAQGLKGLEFHAPMMRRGDVVVWSSRVFHGSLKPEFQDRSRNSLTAHYIGLSHQHIQYGTAVELDLLEVNGMPVRYLRPVREPASEGSAA